MNLTVTTHLNFHGEARAALEFYRSVFGGTIAITTYGDLGARPGSSDADRVVFGHVEAATGFRIMGYDVPAAGGLPAAGGDTRRQDGMTITGQPFFVSVRGERLGQVQGYWDGLAAGAVIVEALAPSPWSPGFGMLTDRFGVTWIIDIAAPSDAG